MSWEKPNQSKNDFGFVLARYKIKQNEQRNRETRIRNYIWLVYTRYLRGKQIMHIIIV